MLLQPSCHPKTGGTETKKTLGHDNFCPCELHKPKSQSQTSNEFPHFLLPGDRGNRGVFGHLTAKDNNKNKVVALETELICYCLKKMVSHDNRSN